MTFIQNGDIFVINDSTLEREEKLINVDIVQRMKSCFLLPLYEVEKFMLEG